MREGEKTRVGMSERREARGGRGEQSEGGRAVQ